MFVANLDFTSDYVTNKSIVENKRECVKVIQLGKKLQCELCICTRLNLL